MLEIFKISGGCHRSCRIYFTSIPLFGPHALRLLKTFLLVLFNSFDIQCVDQKGLDIIERSLVRT